MNINIKIYPIAVLLKHSLRHDSLFFPVFIYSFNTFRYNLKFCTWANIQMCNKVIENP